MIIVINIGGSIMKAFFRVLIAIVIMPVLLSMTSCAAKKDHTYSSKKLISLQDIEKLLKDDGIEIVNRGPSEGNLDTLQQKHCTTYFLNHDKVNVLNIFVFSSEKERKKGRAEYDEKTAAISMLYQEIYEAKNVMLILSTGDKSNIYYSKVSSAIKKIK